MMIFSSLFLLSLLRTYSINGVSAESIDIHHLLNTELREFHNITVEDGAYDIVQFWHKNTTSDNYNGKQLKFKKSEVDVILTMKETSVIRWSTPIWVLEADGKLTEVENAIHETITFYESEQPSIHYEGPSVHSTIAHGIDESGNGYFIGQLGDKNLVPISKEIAAALRKHKPHLFKEELEPGSFDEFGEFELSHPHLIYTPGKSKTGKIRLVSREQNNILRKSKKSNNRTSYDRVKRSSVDIVYPEILLIFALDQDFPSVRNFRFLRLIFYIINFWNSVDLRFRDLKDPEVRLRIVGIIIVKEAESVSFFKENFNSFSQLKADEMNGGILRWVESRICLLWDLIVVQTSAELVTTDSAVYGVTFFGDRCSDRKPWIAIVHDKMDYGGIRTATHEVGHMLGAEHDESIPSHDCEPSRRYLMTAIGSIHSTHRWSWCSKSRISSHLRNDAGDCYDNDIPWDHEGELLDTLYLPGDEKSSEDQCRDRGYLSVQESLDFCRQLYCCTSSACKDTGHALDGTPCPLGICLIGKCVIDGRQQ